MKIIDCYYIKGVGKDSKCYKIHGVGIAYNVSKTFVYGKAIMAISTALAIPPLGVVIGVGVTQGFLNAGAGVVKNSSLLRI